jgi:hypothetical protein
MNYPNNVTILWNSDWVKAVVEMCIEHYVPKLKDTCLMINTCNEQHMVQYKQANPNQKIILYNLEHKYPLDAYGKPHCCSLEWEHYFRGYMTLIDEVWDFNIENKEYFDSIGFGDRFKFMPLRYTSWFERFITDHTPHYDLEFEGVFDTDFRLNAFRKLTTTVDDGKCMRLKIANTENVQVKYWEKQDAKYCLDIPHYDYPETINATRIHEAICLNRPVIVYDHWNVGSRKYFGDLCIYVDTLDTQRLYQLTQQEPPRDIANRFKELTYTDDAFERYRNSF